MTGSFGLSFAPTDQNFAENGRSQTPIADAIKVLSLRIPQFHGGIAPRELLTGGGSAGLPGGGGVPGGLEEWLRRVFSARQSGAPGSIGATPGSIQATPPPRVWPGTGNWPNEGSGYEPPAPTPPPVWRGGPVVQNDDLMTGGGAEYGGTPARVSGGLPVRKVGSGSRTPPPPDVPRWRPY